MKAPVFTPGPQEKLQILQSLRKQELSGTPCKSWSFYLHFGLRLGQTDGAIAGLKDPAFFHQLDSFEALQNIPFRLNRAGTLQTAMLRHVGLSIGTANIKGQRQKSRSTLKADES